MINKVFNKKSISIVLTLCLGVSLFYTALSNIDNDKIVYAKAKDSNEKKFSNNAEILNVNNDEESIYVIQNADGSEKKKILSKTSGNKNEQTEITTDIPVTQSIKYFIDDKEISPDKMSGRSGKVTIEFDYKNLSQAQNIDGKFIPFAVLTGLALDNDIYSNVEVSSGKIFNDADKCVVVGVSIPGMNKFLGLSNASLKNTINICDSFKVTANVKNFSLLTTMSLVTNDVFNDIDINSINDISSLLNNLNDLGSGMQALITGSSKLENGIKSLKDGSLQLVQGSDKLKNGVNALYDGALRLDSGIDLIHDSVTDAVEKTSLLKGVADQTVQSLNDAYSNYQATRDTFTEQQKGFLDSLFNELLQGCGIVDGGIGQVNEKIGEMIDVFSFTGQGKTLKDASSAIKNGIGGNPGNDLKSGIEALCGGMNTAEDGINRLLDGSNQLSEGLNKYNEEGIKKIVGLSDSQEVKAISKFKEMINNSKSYHSYLDKEKKEGNVKFIFRTDGIKGEKKKK